MRVFKKKYFYSFLLSILIFGILLIMPAFISKVSYKDLFGILFSIYFLLPLLVFKKADSKKVKLFKILITLAPVICIYLIFPVLIGNARVLPLGLAIALSGLLGFLTSNNVFFRLVISLAVFYIGYYGYPKYTREISYQQSLINEPLVDNLMFFDSIFKDNSKPLILEFWNSACGQCIKDFPKFQKFYNENKNKYEIHSVNIPWRRDKEKGFNPNRFIDSLGFDFPVLSMEYDDAKKIGVNQFPTAIVINENSIIYRGRIHYYESNRYNFLNILNRIIIK